MKPFFRPNSRPMATHLPYWLVAEIRSALFDMSCEGDLSRGPVMDLRGSTITIKVSEDGQDITVEVAK